MNQQNQFSAQKQKSKKSYHFFKDYSHNVLNTQSSKDNLSIGSLSPRSQLGLNTNQKPLGFNTMNINENQDQKTSKQDLKINLSKVFNNNDNLQNNIYPQYQNQQQHNNSNNQRMYSPNYMNNINNNQLNNSITKQQQTLPMQNLTGSQQKLPGYPNNNNILQQQIGKSQQKLYKFSQPNQLYKNSINNNSQGNNNQDILQQQFNNQLNSPIYKISQDNTNNNSDRYNYQQQNIYNNIQKDSVLSQKENPNQFLQVKQKKTRTLSQAEYIDKILKDKQIQMQQEKLNNFKKQDSVQTQNNKKTSKQSFRKSRWRWVILLLISIFSLASYYGLQVPSPLQDQFINEYGINQTQYNNLFVMFSLPNILLPLLAGPLSQKIGMWTATFIYTVTMMIGAYIQYYSSIDQSYAVLMTGTIIFGIGVNGSVVMINSFTCHWFIGSELSTALAVINAIQYLGQVMASLILNPLYNINNSIGIPLFVSFLIICICMISLIFMYFIQKYADKYDNENGIEVEDHSEDDINLRDLKNFGKLFWQVNLCLFIAYGSLCYNNNIDSLLMTNYAVSGNTAGQLIAMQFLIQLPLTPLIGYFTDQYGKRSQFMIFGSILNVAQFLIFLLVPICPNSYQQEECSSWYYILPLCIGGIGNSFFGAVFAPMVALTVDESHLEMGFGVMDGMQQLGNSIAPVLMGYLLSETKTDNGFFYFFVFTLIIAIIQLIYACYIFKIDIHQIFDTTYSHIKQVQQYAEVHMLNRILLNKGSRSEMFLQPRTLVQPISQKLTKQDKLELVKYQKYVALFGSISMVLSTYLLMSYQDKFETHIQNIVSAFMIIGFFAFIFFVVSFIWSIKLYKDIDKSYDDAAVEVASDNRHIAKYVLISGIVIATIYGVYMVAYQLEYALFKEYLNNQITINIQKLVLGMHPYTNKKGLLLLSFSILNICSLVFLTYIAYIMACKSSTTDKFMIQILALILLVVCFLQINTHFNIVALMKESHNFSQFISTKISILYIVAIITIIFLCLVTWFCYFEENQSQSFLSRMAKYSPKKTKYFLGFSQIFLILITIYPIVINFFEYEKIYKYYIQNCTEELGFLDSRYIESYDTDSCKNKYKYNHSVECPSKNPQDCFQDYNQCAKLNLQIVWERNLVSNPEQNITMACIEKKCCKVLTVIYALPKLQYAIYSLFYVFFSLVMVYFLLIFKLKKEVHNYDKTNKYSKSNEEHIPDEQVGHGKFFMRKADKGYIPEIIKGLAFSFIIVLFLGIIYISNTWNYDENDYFLPTKTQIQGKIKVEPQTDLINYDYKQKQGQEDSFNFQKNHDFVQFQQDSYHNKIFNSNNFEIIQKDNNKNNYIQHNSKHMEKQETYPQNQVLLSQNIQQFNVIIHDIITDKPVSNADITIYQLPDQIKASHYQCNQSLYQRPIFLYVTGDNGVGIFPVEFLNEKQQYNLIIFVQKEGYQGNCRLIQIDSESIKNYSSQDIAIGKILNKNESRVILDWNLEFVNDLDLYINFGQYGQDQQNDNFSCMVSVHQTYCGGVQHHGDSINKLIGKSSEAITLYDIGDIQYLVFINQFIQDLEILLQKPEYQYTSKIQKAQPVIKYYTYGYEWPVKTLAEKIDLSKFNQQMKFSLLQFCINGQKQDERAYVINDELKVWSSLQIPNYNTQISSLPTTASYLIGNNNSKTNVCDLQSSI